MFLEQGLNNILMTYRGDLNIMAIKHQKRYLTCFILIYTILFLSACTKNIDTKDTDKLMAININEREVSVQVNQTIQLSVTKDPVSSNEEIVWESLNVSVATVSNTGLVTGVKEGTATIFVHNETSTVYDSISITVTKEDVKPSPDPVFYSNSVVNFRVSADPSIIRHEGIFYAFVTGVNSKIMTSENLVDWVNTDVAPIPNRPTWATKNAGVWAPDIVKVGDEFIMYYSASVWDDPNPGIGYATAPHPLGPWTDHGKMFLSSEIGVNNSIDPAVFIAEDGNVYMIWGSFRGLYGAQLTADGKSFIGGIEGAKANKVLIAGYDTSLPWNGSTYEAPYVIYRDGYYYLFSSTGLCCEGLNSTYAVRVARSRNPLGPYVDSLDRSMLAGDRGHHVINGTSRMVGPGHNSIIKDDEGSDWIVYHVWDFKDLTTTPPYRTMAIDKLIWDSNGWPAVQYTNPSIKAVVPVINKQTNQE